MEKSFVKTLLKKLYHLFVEDMLELCTLFGRGEKYARLGGCRKPSLIISLIRRSRQRLGIFPPKRLIFWKVLLGNWHLKDWSRGRGTKPKPSSPNMYLVWLGRHRYWTKRVATCLQGRNRISGEIRREPSAHIPLFPL